ncbi:protein RDM1-like [Bidens hawaiensis]|uniref:protein RDM1-like n=1 Tax=Bidens hawaiensis TaxID=980011 RepID=UPI0040499E9A
MKRTMPAQPLDISSDDDDPKQGTVKRPKTELTVITPTKKVLPEDLLTRSAKMYQEYMNEIPIPAQRGSVISFTSWSSLAKSMKQMYRQPLHYLTNVRVKEWDRMRSDAAGDEPLDTVIHPCKAETNIWLMEEVHRLTASYQFLAKLWSADPMYNAFIDSVFPQL